MKKVILIVVLAITAVSCSLFDADEWRESKRRRAESGRECYREYNGHVYCVDKYGNRYY